MSKPKIAFICIHNSCRSQMAEAISKLLASDLYDAYSAGTSVKSTMNPDAVSVIYELYGVDMSMSQRPKSITGLPPVDIAITMGCNVECPCLPCAYREDWGLDDPTGKGRDEFIRTARIIEQKIIQLKAKIESAAFLRTINKS